jgi:hypothetical protein
MNMGVGGELSAEVLTLNVLGPGSIPSITEMAKFPKLL